MATTTPPPGDAQCPGDAPIPLRSWMKKNEREPNKKRQKDDLEEDSTPDTTNGNDQKWFKEFIIRRTTIAYGIAELLKHSQVITMGRWKKTIFGSIILKSLSHLKRNCRLGHGIT